MTTESRVALRQAARRLASEARNEGALTAMGSPEHEFFLGVAAAAEHYLHPERGALDNERWLDKESPAFRSGYGKARSMIAATAAAAPLHFAMPLPD